MNSINISIYFDEGAAAPYGATSPHPPCRYMTSPFPLSNLERGEGERLRKQTRGREVRYAPTPTAGLRPATPQSTPSCKSVFTRVYVSLMVLLFVSILTSGCAYIQSPDINEELSKIEPVDDSWRCIFTEPELVQLIEKALANNIDIRTASLNVVQANAILKASRMAFFPSFSLGIEGGISKVNGSSASYTYNIPVTMQWELNIAELLAKQDAAEVAYQGAIETVHAVQIQIISAIAGHYYSLVSMHAQLAILQKNNEIALKTIETMEALKEAGILNETAISQARAQYLSALASEKDMLRQIRSTENSIFLLLGNNQTEISYNISPDQELAIDYEQTVSLLALGNRPDVKAAEYELKAKIADVDIARASFYPSLNITGSVGWTNNLGEIVNPGKVLLNLIGSIVQPLFNRGQSVANLTIAKAEQEKAVLAFNQALLVAGTELNEALTSCQISHERFIIHQQEAEESQKAYDVSMELMQHGSGTYLEVLSAESSLLQSELALSNDWLDIVQGIIYLCKKISQ